MRKFYIFNINDEFKVLNKDNAYDLYRQMENIKHLNKNEFYNGIKIYETLASIFDKYKIDEYLYDLNKDSYFYTKYKNIHIINNYYRGEESRLTICKAYLLLETNAVKCSFFDNLKNMGLFACDFENKDYFWLDSLYNS